MSGRIYDFREERAVRHEDVRRKLDELFVGAPDGFVERFQEAVRMAEELEGSEEQVKPSKRAEDGGADGKEEDD